MICIRRRRLSACLGYAANCGNCRDSVWALTLRRSTFGICKAQVRYSFHFQRHQTPLNQATPVKSHSHVRDPRSKKRQRHGRQALGCKERHTTRHVYAGREADHGSSSDAHARIRRRRFLGCWRFLWCSAYHRHIQQKARCGVTNNIQRSQLSGEECDPAQVRERSHKAALTLDMWARLSRVQTNAFKRDEDNDAATLLVFDITSKINHSCRPNACWEWGSTKLQGVVHALQPISAGDEITLCYGLTAESTLCSTADRRAHLMSIWNFDCGCPVCTTGAEDQARIAARTLYQRTCRNLVYPDTLPEITSGAQNAAERRHQCDLHRTHAASILNL